MLESIIVTFFKKLNRERKGIEKEKPGGGPVGARWGPVRVR